MESIVFCVFPGVGVFVAAVSFVALAFICFGKVFDAELCSVVAAFGVCFRTGVFCPGVVFWTFVFGFGVCLD